MIKRATFSEDGEYRYSLSRIWNQSKLGVQFVLLNPSTADDKNDDPTVRRCINFAKQWGYGSLEVRNIFSLRCTKPRNLYRAVRPIGENRVEDIIASQSVVYFAKIVFGWGSHGKLLRRGRWVMDVLRDKGLPIYCFGFTKNGQPKHPLYLKKSEPLVRVYTQVR